MPKPRKNQLICCPHFKWRLLCRGGVWYADGRSNSPSAGRHSLATKDHAKARRLLVHLDQRVAEELGLVPRNKRVHATVSPLTLDAGRKLYEQHLSRTRATGGVKQSTRKKYRSTLDKFLPFASSQGITDWNSVDASLLIRYANYLESKSLSHKTQVNELTTLKQLVKWLVRAGHLQGTDPIDLPLKKAESQRPYCWRPEEVTAIVDYCRAAPKLGWLADVITALACTGLRISELSDMRWGDVDLKQRMLSLPDESGYADKPGLQKRGRKSGRSRMFPIHPDLLEVLIRQRRRGACVFHGPRGGRLKPDFVRNVLVNKVIHQLAAQFPGEESTLGFRDGRLHSFRHFFVSHCANNNVPERMVMEWLGHKDSEMIRHYYHLCDIESKRHMNRLDPLGTGCKWEIG